MLPRLSRALQESTELVEQEKGEIEMPTMKEIFDAGRAALGLTPYAPAAAPTAAAGAPAATAPAVATAPGGFDPAAFTFAPGPYRIHFKNGLSGEYDGAALATSFPFPVDAIERVEPIEDVGA